MRRFGMGVVVGAIGIGLVGGQIADRILTGNRLLLSSEDGSPAVVAGADPSGAGMLVIYDAKGKEVFAVRNGQVSAPMQTSSSAKAPPPGSFGQVMQLLRVEPIEPDPNIFIQIDGLRREAIHLENIAREAEGKTFGEDRKINAHNRQIALDFKNQAQEKRALASRLERDAKVPRQRIIGWNGQREVILETERDLSQSLSKIPPDSFLKWVGVRRELNNESEVFDVMSIEPASRPAIFAERP